MDYSNKNRAAVLEEVNKYIEKYEALADRMVKAISAMAENEDNLDNFRSYLTYSFGEWLEKFCKTPEGMVEEFEMFGYMYCEEERKSLADLGGSEIVDLLREHEELRREFEGWLMSDASDYIVSLLHGSPNDIEWEVDAGRGIVTILCKHPYMDESDYRKVVDWVSGLVEEYPSIPLTVWEDRKAKLDTYISALHTFWRVTDEGWESMLEYMNTSHDSMMEYIEKTIDMTLDEVSRSLEDEFIEAKNIDYISDMVFCNGWLNDYYIKDGDVYEITEDRKVA